jgi:polyribonucleotide nucleotidyltransferase
LHISEVSWKRLESLEGVLKEGDMVKVKLTGTDPKTGKFKLSRKALLPKPDGPPRSEGGQPRNGNGQERPQQSAPRE